MTVLPVTADRAKTAIAEAKTLPEVKEIRDQLEMLRGYAVASGKGRDKINDLAEPKALAEWKAGGMLRDVERYDHPGTRQTDGYYATLDEIRLSEPTARRWQAMWHCPEEDLHTYFAKQRANGEIITSADVYRLGKKHMPHEVDDSRIVLDGKYSCLVIDPPWKMNKIERDVRPNQAGFEYPTMTEAELVDPECQKWRGSPPTSLTADDCHLYLWTTHKHLPTALRLSEAWGFRYECLMTWVKNVGFTPFSWMRATEHILFCRRGSLPLERLGLRLDFNAKVREHSRKPDEFYDLVQQASPGPRLDMFSREPRDGFDQWGNQTGKFRGAA